LTGRAMPVKSAVESADLRKLRLLASPRLPHTFAKEIAYADRKNLSAYTMAEGEGFAPWADAHG